MDDEALLNEELHWSPGSNRRSRRPAGANAITAIGLVLTLVLWAITAALLTRFLEGPSGSGMIDPKSMVALLVFGIEMFVAGALAGRVWVAIGPGARGLLRPIAVLGPWPMLGIAFFVTVAVVSPFVAPFLPKKSEVVREGRNWYFARASSPDATYENALTQCRQNRGRVPSRDEIGLFDPPFPRENAVWIAKPEDADQPLELTTDGRFAPVPGESRRHVVCFRP